jgi:hypothetical protein
MLIFLPSVDAVESHPTCPVRTQGRQHLKHLLSSTQRRSLSSHRALPFSPSGRYKSTAPSLDAFTKGYTGLIVIKAGSMVVGGNEPRWCTASDIAGRTDDGMKMNGGE